LAISNWGMVHFLQIVLYKFLHGGVTENSRREIASPPKSP
jgi:hypothetical protein